MKILHVNNSADGGGTETYIHRIIECLEREGHTSSLYVQEFAPGNHPVHALVNTRRNIRKLQEINHRFDPDVIHVHNINNFRILECLRSWKPCLKSVHEYRPFCTPLRVRPDTGAVCDDCLSLRCFRTGCFSLNPASVYRYCVEKRAAAAIGRFPAVWVMSRFMARMIRSVLPDPSVLEIVPYFYDPPQDPPPPLPEQPRIFTAGRLVPGKGFDVLLDILTGVTTPFELRIAGDGPERPRLEMMAREKNIPAEFLGYMPSEQLVDHYRWSRLVVFPSTYPEPFGIVGLEAMGAARPVVAFDVGGIPDWLVDGQVGYCIPAYDKKLFADKVNVLLEDFETAQKMGDEGRKRVLQVFSSKLHVSRLLATYRRLAAKP